MGSQDRVLLAVSTFVHVLVLLRRLAEPHVSSKSKKKAVPLHAMEALEGRGI
jgi:hypothetical protein